MPVQPRCSLCHEAGEACMFHSAGSPAMLVRTLEGALSQRGALAFSDFITSALARLETAVPEGAQDMLADLDPNKLYRRFGKLLAQPEFTTAELRKLAGMSLALAMIADAAGETVGDEDGDDDDDDRA